MLSLHGYNEGHRCEHAPNFQISKHTATWSRTLIIPSSFIIYERVVNRVKNSWLFFWTYGKEEKKKEKKET